MRALARWPDPEAEAARQLALTPKAKKVSPLALASYRRLSFADHLSECCLPQGGAQLDGIPGWHRVGARGARRRHTPKCVLFARVDFEATVSYFGLDQLFPAAEVNSFQFVALPREE